MEFVTYIRARVRVCTCPNISCRCIGFTRCLSYEASVNRTAADLHSQPTCAVVTTGSWNYGVDFGGPTKSSWTSGANTDRAMHGVRGEGAFGNSFVGDSAYAATTGGTSTAGVTMCQGTTTG